LPPRTAGSLNPLHRHQSTPGASRPSDLPTASADDIADLTRHDKEHRSPEFPREMRTQCGPTECPGRDREPAAITNSQVDGGRTGIRTQERVAPLAVFKTDWAALATRSDKVNPSSDLGFCVSTNRVDSPRFPANHGPNTDPRTLLEDGFDSPRHVQFHRIGDRRFWKIADTSQVCIPPSLASVVAPDHLLLFIGAVPGVGLDRNTVVEDADDVSDQRPADYESATGRFADLHRWGKTAPDLGV
jgi:hypothetical protein